MHPIRLLARALPRSISGETVMASTGVNKEAGWVITSEAMSGLSDYAMKYAFWRFCGDDSQKRVIRVRLLAIARAKARDAGYKMKLETVVGITNAAIEQAMQPWCTRCNGVSHRDDSGELKICRKCKGTVQVQLTKDKIAANCNCNRKALKENHMSLYNFLLDVIRQWDGKVIAQIKKNHEADLLSKPF